MNCPKCGTQYKCACGTCKGEGWEMGDEFIKCLTCGLTQHHDWWFNLEMDIYREELLTKENI